MGGRMAWAPDNVGSCVEKREAPPVPQEPGAGSYAYLLGRAALESG
jgi:hypothetical protein